MTFSDYKFSPEIMTQIEAQGYTTPTPIQEQAIPSVLAGKDVMGLAHEHWALLRARECGTPSGSRGGKEAEEPHSGGTY